MSAVSIIHTPDTPGRFSIIVDEHEVGDRVTRYWVEQQLGELPRVILEGRGLDVVFEGLADVSVVEPPSSPEHVGRAMSALLAKLSPAEVERLALEAHGWGVGDGNLTAATLQVLADLVGGGDGKIGQPGG